MNLPSQVSAVTFDVGGTLIAPWPSVGEIYAAAAVKHGAKNVSAKLLKERFVAAWRALADFNHTREEWAALVDATFQGLTERPPSQTFFPELFEHFGRPDAWRMFDDALPALDALASRGLKLGVISNWDDRLRPLLRGLNLSRYFEAILVSCEVGFPKPSHVIFDAAAEKLGLAPEAILHVGDSLPQDVEGAREAGFHSLLVQRGVPTQSGERISSLLELYDTR